MSKKWGKGDNFYCHCRDVKWLGETSKDDLTDTSLKPLKASITIFNLNQSAKNELLENMDSDKIEWTEFYMEFADKLIEYKNNRSELIKKIQNIFQELGMILPTLERDIEGNIIVPFDIDPFTIFALFNKQISIENRINIIKQIKNEFALDCDVPNTFHGIAVVNNLKVTFYYFTGERGDEDIDNLWELFEIALNYSNNDKLRYCAIHLYKISFE